MRHSRINKYRCIVADPAWQFDDDLPGKGRGAAKHYATLDALKINGFGVPPIADDAFLFLWRVAAMAEESYAVVRAWGFTPKAEIVWVKSRKPNVYRGDSVPLLLDVSSLAFGMGRVGTRGSHETCIVATRGKPKRLSASERSVFFAPRGKHSAKPDAFFALVERLVAGPRLELFARKSREGWTTLGYEMGAGVRS